MRQPASRRKHAGQRPDFAVLVGPCIAAAGILTGLFLEGGRVNDLHQFSAALIVFGGTAGAMVLTTPLDVIRSALRRIGALLWVRHDQPAELIARLADYAKVARWHGLAALEPTALAIQDPFWRKALLLAVDEAEEDTIRQAMDLEMNVQGMQADNDAGVLEAAAGYSPTIGILGAILGLIQVMKHLDDISAVGAGIATAFVATIYGVGLANLVLLPLAQRLRLRSQRTMLMNELVVEGVIGIRQGMNPVLLRVKLGAFAPSGRLPEKPKIVVSNDQPRALSA
jgi:chemotaxis protein MotA